MKKIRLGLGFATGRKSFRKVLSACLNDWDATRKQLPMEAEVSLHLLVAYDLDYHHTQSTDYTNLSQRLVDQFDSMIFYGAKNALRGLEQAAESGTLSRDEIKTVFGAGYAGKRNALLFAAMENNMDYLLFLDDDEYPMAVTNNHNVCLWSGQNVIRTHLEAIPNADYTNGLHCGYVSPIPQIQFDDRLNEDEFCTFIEAISNDIVNWEKIKLLMQTGGVTYASTDILRGQTVAEVDELGGCKFISGANLCLNLTQPTRTFAFYNPPGARGEDTFLSTMLHDRTVLQVPCYTFHDGFSSYPHLLEGALPIHLDPITAQSPAIVTRFLAACTGWVRYKPLLVRITAPERFDEEMDSIRRALADTLPRLAAHFEAPRFLEIAAEFEKYRRNVDKHHRQYLQTQAAWSKLVGLLEQETVEQ